MERNEVFSAEQLTHVRIRLLHASITICPEDVEEAQLILTGAKAAVNAVRCKAENGCLTISAPLFSPASIPGEAGELEAMLLVPREWKGDVAARVLRGRITAQDISGTDIRLHAFSGSVYAEGLKFITLLTSVQFGKLTLQQTGADRLTIRSGFAAVSGDDLAVQDWHVKALGGSAELSMSECFQRFSAVSCAADVRLWAPTECCDAVLRTVSGRILTGGVSIVENSPTLRMHSVRGNLEINNNIVY